MSSTSIKDVTGLGNLGLNFSANGIANQTSVSGSASFQSVLSNQTKEQFDGNTAATAKDTGKAPEKKTSENGDNIQKKDMENGDEIEKTTTESAKKDDTKEVKSDDSKDAKTSEKPTSDPSDKTQKDVTNGQVEDEKMTSEVIASETILPAETLKAEEIVLETPEETVEVISGPADSKETIRPLLPNDEEETETAFEVKQDDKPVMSEEQLAAAEEILATVVVNFTEKAAEILNTDKDALTRVFEVNEVSTSDLTDPKVANDILFDLVGAEDSLALLTDETKYEQFQQLGNALQEIVNADSSFEEMSVKELNEMVELQKPVEKPLTDTPITTKASEEENFDTVKREDSEIGLTSQMQTEDGSTLGMVHLLKNQQNRREEQEGHSHSENHGNFQQMQNNDFSVDPQVKTDSFVPTEHLADTEDVTRQVMDYLKAQIKVNTDTIEMQLHPASLGTVQVNIANKNGVMTANFITQNEQVKAVLENQMIQLQERFEDQGIKVEAISVTVETHSFKNDGQNRGSGEQRDRDEKVAAPRKTRRLHLGPDFDEESLEELSEEERLTAEMMQANGGTVDYLA